MDCGAPMRYKAKLYSLNLRHNLIDMEGINAGSFKICTFARWQEFTSTFRFAKGPVLIAIFILPPLSGMQMRW